MRLGQDNVPTTFQGSILMQFLAAISALFVEDGPIERWQTLIAGLLALLAAMLALRPVWRQLSLTAVQTNTALREFLQDRLRTFEQHRDGLITPLKAYIDPISRRMYEIGEFEGGQVQAEWAFGTQQGAYEPIRLLQQYRSRGADTPGIEATVGVLVEKLEALATTFDTIHTPHSRDQVGDDYAHSDDEWAAIRAEAKEAEAELPAAVRACTLVLDRLIEAFDAEASRIRTQIRTTEKALLNAKT